MNAKISLETLVEEIPYEDPFEAYRRLTRDGSQVSLLMESRSRDLRYGRQSIIVPAPSLSITGRNDYFRLEALDELGREIMRQIAGVISQDDSYRLLDEKEIIYPSTRQAMREGKLCIGELKSSRSKSRAAPEEERLRNASLAGAIRAVLNSFSSNDEHAGLYGTFSYDFVRQFEDIGHRFIRGGEVFSLFLPSEVYVFDDIRERAFRKRYFGTAIKTQPVSSQLKSGKNDICLKFDMGDAEYIAKVARIVEEIKRGELIQAVLSRTASVNIQQAPTESYGTLRRINPSPYCFFFNLGGGEALFGASPELHVKVTNGHVEIRPLAGTARRPGDAVSDYHARMQLLNDVKEQREHTMLVDLARNDIGRVCDSVEVTEFMAIEEYPNLYHMGSGVTGKLSKGRDALDCLIATLPAGTVSGAPKVRAMQLIEELENSRRGPYGGCIGSLSFNGNCNTGLTLRSVYVDNGRAYVRAGAGIVHHSIPEKELQEVNLKNANQLRALGVR